MRKIFVFMSMIVCLLLVGCGTPQGGEATKSTTTTTTVTILSEAQVLEIASDYWDIKSGDIDEETGFPYSFKVVKNENFIVTLNWLVDNDHFSTVDTIEIHPVTGTVIHK